MESLEAPYFSPSRGHWSRNTHVTVVCIRNIYIGLWWLGVWVGWGGSFLCNYLTCGRGFGLSTYLFMFTSTSPPLALFYMKKEKVLLQILRDYRVELRTGRPAGRQSLLLYSLAVIKLAIKLI
jgi:hypothetical protein